MMTCLEFRRRVGAEPALAGPGFDEHRRECPACARYQDELRAMDALAARALAVRGDRLALPGSRAPRSTGARPRWYAIAASVAVGITVGLVLLLAEPRESIAREVVGHVMHEPQALLATSPVDPAALTSVLDPDGTRLRPGAGDVTFAARCVYQQRVVPHLVVRTPSGAVTVLLLRHREMKEPMRFEEQGFAGVVLPAPRGSIAIVGQGVKDLEGVAQQVFEAVDWGDSIPAAG